MVNPMKKEQLDESIEKFLMKTRIQFRKGELMTFKQWMSIVGNLLDELD